MKRILLQCSILAACMSSACMTGAPHGKRAPALAAKAPSSDRYVEVEGAWLRVRDSGPVEGASNAAPILLVHGYGSRLETWGAVQPALAKTRRVVSFDQRGFGQSERPGGEYGPARHARDLELLAAKLGLEKPILVGHSYGGGVVLRAALDAPSQFSALVLVDAFALDEQLPPMFQWAKVPGLGEFIFATQFKEVVGEKFVMAFRDRERFSSPAAIAEYRNNMLVPGAMYAALHTVRGMDYADHQDQYKNIQLPVAIVWGEDDRVTPLRFSKILAGQVDGATVTVLGECGHVPPWERPEAVMQVVDGLARQVDRGDLPLQRTATKIAVEAAP